MKGEFDWEAIERDYRAGLLSLREIGGRYGISETAIRKRAKRDAWERDLAARIEAKAEALVRNAEVRAEVRSKESGDDGAVIAANAEAIMRVRLSHRADIRHQRDVARRLTERLVSLCGDDEVQQSAIRQAVVSGDDGQLATLAKKIKISADVLSSLVGSTKALIAMEREAWHIGAGQDAVLGSPITQIRRIIVDPPDYTQHCGKEPPSR